MLCFLFSASTGCLLDLQRASGDNCVFVRAVLILVHLLCGVTGWKGNLVCVSHRSSLLRGRLLKHSIIPASFLTVLLRHLFSKRSKCPFCPLQEAINTHTGEFPCSYLRWVYVIYFMVGLFLPWSPNMDLHYTDASCIFLLYMWITELLGLCMKIQNVTSYICMVLQSENPGCGCRQIAKLQYHCSWM